ncbi:hypothetical protein Tco_0566867 [Tanacetum coccineum]
MRILSVVSVQVEKKFSYGYLNEIVMKRADQQLYKFIEGSRTPELGYNTNSDIVEEREGIDRGWIKNAPGYVSEKMND